MYLFPGRFSVDRWVGGVGDFQLHCSDMTTVSPLRSQMLIGHYLSAALIYSSIGLA